MSKKANEQLWDAVTKGDLKAVMKIEFLKLYYFFYLFNLLLFIILDKNTIITISTTIQTITIAGMRNR